MSAIDGQPSRGQLRRFAWILAMTMALFAWSGLKPVPSLCVQIVAALIFTIGTIWPRTFRRVFLVMQVITAPVGQLVGGVLLTVIFFGLITPLALVFRCLGRDPLRRQLQPGAISYWQPRLRVTGLDRYFRQF